jgi:hypothetical protein
MTAPPTKANPPSSTNFLKRFWLNIGQIEGLQRRAKLNLRGIGARKAIFLGNLVVIRLGIGVLHDQELICRQRSVRADHWIIIQTRYLIISSF